MKNCNENDHDGGDVWILMGMMRMMTDDDDCDKWFPYCILVRSNSSIYLLQVVADLPNHSEFFDHSQLLFSIGFSYFFDNFTYTLLWEMLFLSYF